MLTTEELLQTAPEWLMDRKALDYLHLTVIRQDNALMDMMIMEHPLFQILWREMEPKIRSIGENPCRILWEGFFEMFLETDIARLIQVTETRTGEKWIVKR